MNPIKNILACLDLTYIDPIVTEYTDFLVGITGAEKAYFLHVIQEYDLSGKGGRDLPEDEEIYELIYKKIKKEVHSSFNKQIPVGIETQIATEDAATAIIDFIAETKIDLTLIGRKTGAYREARYGHKILSGADCDIMFIPEKSTHNIKKILCAIDGSKDAEVAFAHAVNLSEKSGAALISYFLYDTTETYFPATTQSSASIHQERLHEKYDKFLKKFNRSPEDIICHFRELAPSENQADKVYEIALDENADMIIVGATGDLGTSTTLLGNIALNFNNIEIKTPLLLIKNERSKRFLWF